MKKYLLKFPNRSFFLFLKRHNQRGNDVTIIGYEHLDGKDYIKVMVEKGKGLLKFDDGFGNCECGSVNIEEKSESGL